MRDQSKFLFSYYKLALFVLLLLSSTPADSQSTFDLKLAAGAIVSLRRAGDSFPTEYIQNNRRLGDVSLRYRGKDGAWQSVDTTQLANDGKVVLTNS
ncbi:MAG TPA: hypothetical protein VIJ87_17850, partial [Pyrinomonadaceae bacterium]